MSDLGDKVMKEIRDRGLRPTPLYVFLAQRSVFWLLAALATLLNAFAFAFLIFGFQDLRETNGKQLDEMAFDDAAIYLPIAAVIFFTVFAVSAAFAYRNTRGGYRVKPWVATLAATLLGMTLGAGLHMMNAGSAIHDYLSADFASYREYTAIPYAEWSRPDDGFLGGTAIQELPGGRLRLRDFSGRDWMVDVTGAEVTFDGSLVDEGDIAMRGRVTGQWQFKATRIEPFD